MRQHAPLTILISIAVLGFCFLLSNHTTLSASKGIRIKLRVATDDAITEVLFTDAGRIDLLLRSKGIPFESSKCAKEKAIINITGVDLASDTDVYVLINHIYYNKYQVRKTELVNKISYELSLLPDYTHQIRESAVKQFLDEFNLRLEALDLEIPHNAKVFIQNANAKEVSDYLIVEFPFAEDWNRIKGWLGEPIRFELCLVKKDNGGPFSSVEKAIAGNGENISLGKFSILYCLNKKGTWLVVSDEPVITSIDVITTRRSVDRKGSPIVKLSLTSDGAKLLGDVTENHIGEKLAIILDNIIFTTFIIHKKIESEVVLEGPFTIKQAEDLALLLRSNRFLGIRVEVLEELTIPSN